MGELMEGERENRKLMQIAIAMIEEGEEMTKKDENTLQEMLAFKVSSRDRARALLDKLTKMSPARYSALLREVIAEDIFD
jgi:hypothetical protein